MTLFNLKTEFEPSGDQPTAIASLVAGVNNKQQYQTLLGVTGSGKTFTIANVISQLQRPTLVMAPNKTLAAQLYSEFAELFPENAVKYFVSYYDYYQPEAYIPSRDVFIEKDSAINEEIDKMRHDATRSLFERRDVIIVASVSCIYGLGSPDAYKGLSLSLKQNQNVERDEVLRELIKIQYVRNDHDFHRGSFRVRGDVLEIFPSHEEERALRVEFFGDEIDAISEFDPIRGSKIESVEECHVYPASHYVTREPMLKKALVTIQEELEERLKQLEILNKPLEAHRLKQRTLYDLELLEEMGVCKGIENYSRHLTGARPGDPPPTLIDYFPDDFLLVMDESHISVPQVGAMYKGDRSRKNNLVEYGFRLPSALDNRPLKFEEFEQHMYRTIFVSATPANYELEHSEDRIVEQIVRPTGLLDPPVHIRPVRGQVDEVIDLCHGRIAKNERILVTTLTKRMAEDLTKYLSEVGIQVRYLHSDVENIERVELIRDLRKGVFDVLVGINLLREGLDMPEVSLVCVLDADKEGFLRSVRSLIQICGRAARNLNGEVYLFADKITKSIQQTLEETDRRRKIQNEYNEKHGIVPQGIVKKIRDILPRDAIELDDQEKDNLLETITLLEIPKKIKEIKVKMKASAADLDFEAAADLRDQIKFLRQRELELS